MRRVYFIIHAISRIDGDRIAVSGRNCEDDIRLGDTLMVTPHLPEGEQRVTVSAIEIYGKPSDFFASGYTGTLIFASALASSFTLDSVLSGTQAE